MRPPYDSDPTARIMSLRRRILRIFAILVLVGLFAGYFAFSTFLFNPMESDFEADVSTLVPRNVDFFVAKARLSRDFGEFPTLEVYEDLEDTHGWRTFRRSPECEDLFARYDIPSVLQQLEELPARLRGLDPISLFGGRDLAIAGFFEGQGRATAEWAAYGRVSGLGKLGVSLLRYPGLLGLGQQGLSVLVEDDHLALSGGQLPQPIYLTRHRDVVVVGNSRALVQQALELRVRSAQDSLGQSADYNDQIQESRLRRSGDELELFVDTRAMMEGLQLSGRWPDVQSQDFWPAFFGRLFQLGSLNKLMGLLAFQGGIQADLHGELSSELITAVQARLYDRPGVDRYDVVRYAGLAAEDSHLFLLVSSDVGTLLREMVQSFEPDLRDNLDTLLRATGEFRGWSQLVDELEPLFEDRVAIVIRDNDYPYVLEKDPPNDGATVQAWAVVLWKGGDQDRAKQKILDYHNLVHSNWEVFGLKSRTVGERGVYRNETAGGFLVWEFWNPLVPGTGHISTGQSGRVYVISNTFKLVEDVLNNYGLDERDRQHRVGNRADFQAMVQSSGASANAVAWFNPREASEFLRQLADQTAEAEILWRIDWREERGKQEAKALREHFPGRTRAELGPDEVARLNEIVQPVLDEMERRIKEEQVPVKQAEYRRTVTYLEMCSGALAMLRLNPRKFDLSLRAIIPLDE